MLIIVPEIFFQGAMLQEFYFLTFASNVKEKPSFHSAC